MDERKEAKLAWRPARDAVQQQRARPRAIALLSRLFALSTDCSRVSGVWLWCAPVEVSVRHAAQLLRVLPPVDAGTRPLPMLLACAHIGTTRSLNTRWGVCRFQWLSQSRTPCTSMCRCRRGQLLDMLVPAITYFSTSYIGSRTTSQQLRCSCRNNLAGHALDHFQGGSPLDSLAESNRSPHNDLVQCSCCRASLGDTRALALSTLSPHNSPLLLRPNVLCAL